MTHKQSKPPKLALWWLRHACPGSDNDALTGDLIERFHEGQTRAWFWRQVLIAFSAGILSQIRSHWPHFCYAIAGCLLPWLLWDAPALRLVPVWLHWQDLPWPWSQLIVEMSRTAILALLALSVLAGGLMLERNFRWISLLRTAAINLALLALGHYSTDLFPWLLLPEPGNPYQKSFVVPGEVQLLFFFASFLVAAWLGCLPLRHLNELERQAVDHGLAR